MACQSFNDTPTMKTADFLIALMLLPALLRAGPWISYKHHADRASAIVEVRLSAQPGTAAPTLRLLKVLTNRTDHTIVLPKRIASFSPRSDCLRRLRNQQHANLVVFLDLQKNGTFKQSRTGVENGSGAYTSFNPDYPQIIAALSGQADDNNPYFNALQDGKTAIPSTFYRNHCQ